MENEKDTTTTTTPEEKKKISLSDLMANKKTKEVVQHTPNGEKKVETPAKAPKAVTGMSSTALEAAKLKPIHTSQMKDIPKPKPVSTEKPESVKAMERLDAAIERTKKDLTPIIEKGKEIIRENMEREQEKKAANPVSLESETDDFFEDEFAETPVAKNKDLDIDDLPDMDEFEKDFGEDEDDLDEEGIEVVQYNPTTVQDKINESASISEEPLVEGEIRDIYEGLSPEEKEEAIRKSYKDLMAKIPELSPIKNKVDFKTFKIKTKPVSINKVLSSNGTEKVKHSAEWVLPNSNRIVSISELSGSEIAIMASLINRTPAPTLNDFIRFYNIIFKHLEDKNKPATMEQWLKSIDYRDLPHLNFAVYKACFENSNYIPFLCSKCSTTELIKYTIDDLVVYGDDKAKEKVQELLNSDPTSKSTIKETLVQFSDNYAATVRFPSIYGITFESYIFRNNENMVKYAPIIGLMSYITNIYAIDYKTNELVAIDTNPVPNDLRKTIRNRFKVYYKIISGLKSEEFQILNGIVNKMENENEIDISYQIPEYTCPHCHTKQEAEPTENPLSLVFMRHQLTLAAN